MIFAVIAFLLGGLYWQFMYKSAKVKRAEATVALQDEKDREAKLSRDRKERDTLVDDSGNLNREIEQNQKALPTSSELPAFFDMLNRKVGEAGVEVGKWLYRPEVVVGAYVRVPLEVVLSGTYTQLKRFFASLAPRVTATGGANVEQDRIITIEGLTLASPRVKNREILLTASFVAATFRQEAPPDAAPPALPVPPTPAAPPKPAAGSAAGSAVRTGSGSSAVVNPQPGNPMSAVRAKTGAAMTEDQRRVDTAVGSGTEADRLQGGL